MTEWTTVDSEVAYSCDGFDIVRETVTLPDGTRTDFDYHSDTPSVVILPFTPNDQLVVIDEWRHAVGRTNRGLPAGSLDPGEDPVAGVERELREETGYEPESVEQLTTMEPANGFSDAVFHYFVARDCRPSAEQSLDHDETIDVSVASFDEMLAGVEDGSLRDGRSAYGLLYYAFDRSTEGFA